MIVNWQTRRNGTRALVIDSYKFRLNRRSDYRTFWKCNAQGCPMNAISENDEIIFLTDSIHNHGSDDSLMLKNRLYELAEPLITENPFESGLNIYQKARRKLLEEFNFNENIFLHIPIFEEFKDLIYRKKKNSFQRLGIFCF